MLTFVFCVIGLICCKPARDVFHAEDPSIFVMDEVCGMMVSVHWLPKELWIFGGAFFLFRLFDIWKPGPIGRLQKMKSPLSIVWDDLAAGLLANLILQVITRIL